MFKKYSFVLFLSIIFLGCVTKKKYNLQVSKYDTLKVMDDRTNADLAICLSDKEKQENKLRNLQDQLANLKASGTILLNQLTNLSVISQTQAESIKKSLENINSNEAYIKGLQSELSRKDSLNMQLVLNLKGALKDVNDTDIQVKVEGSAVFISVSDKLLFKSGSYTISPRAMVVLGKVAEVLKAQSDLQFMVEGHTDNKPINTGFIKDNWDLSVLRATAVVRVLHKNYGLEPARMIAAGRGEYVPLKPNDNEADRALNRRTRIVIIPQLDQFFKLLTPKN
jgi:chemotaxis protein MotB